MRVLLTITLLLSLSVAGSGLAAAPPDPLDEGIALYQAGRYADALPFFLQATAQRPGDVRGWIWLGATYVQLQRWNDALPPLRRAVALEPQNAAAYLLLGVALTRLGQIDAARAAFEHARALGGDGPYGSAAAQWLAFLAAPRGTPPPPVAAPPACSPAPPLPAARPPADIPDVPATIKISDWNAIVSGDQLVIDATVDNNGSVDVQDIRVQVTGIGLTGTLVGTTAVTLSGLVEAGDGRNFQIRLGTTPPPLWARMEILTFVGRTGVDRLHAVLIPIPTDRYAEFARARVKIATAITPTAAAREHVVCVWVSDAAGLPVESVRARVTATGTTSAGPVPQSQSVDIAGGQAVPLKFSWTAAATVTVRVAIEGVRLAALSRE